MNNEDNLLQQIVKAGAAKKLNLDRYRSELEERSPRKNPEQALKHAFHANRERLQQKYPHAYLDYNTVLEEIHIYTGIESDSYSETVNVGDF